MRVFERYLLNKDKLLRRRVEIEDKLYNELCKVLETYDASINKLVNLSIIELIETEDITIYERDKSESSTPHNFAIRETSYKKLEELKAKYGISISKLINIAIYNTLYN